MPIQPLAASSGTPGRADPSGLLKACTRHASCKNCKAATFHRKSILKSTVGGQSRVLKKIQRHGSLARYSRPTRMMKSRNISQRFVKLNWRAYAARFSKPADCVFYFARCELDVHAQNLDRGDPHTGLGERPQTSLKRRTRAEPPNVM